MTLSHMCPNLEFQMYI